MRFSYFLLPGTSSVHARAVDFLCVHHRKRCRRYGFPPPSFEPVNCTWWIALCGLLSWLSTLDQPLEMSGDGQMEVHYMNTAFPYSNTENFMDHFEGLTHVPANYANFGLMRDQVSLPPLWNFCWFLWLCILRGKHEFSHFYSNICPYEHCFFLQEMKLINNTILLIWAGRVIHGIGL